MTEVITTGPTLQEEVEEAVQKIQALPARTLNRYVGLIMQGGATIDEELRELIQEVALGWERVNWTSVEIARLEEDLTSEETRLKIWILKFASRIRS